MLVQFVQPVSVIVHEDVVCESLSGVCVPEDVVQVFVVPESVSHDQVSGIIAPESETNAHESVVQLQSKVQDEVIISPLHEVHVSSAKIWTRDVEAIIQARRIDIIFFITIMLLWLNIVNIIFQFLRIDLYTDLHYLKIILIYVFSLCRIHN